MAVLVVAMVMMMMMMPAAQCVFRIYITVGLSITYFFVGMYVFRCHFVWAHQETSGHVCISLLFANCMNRETNLKLKDPNASDNTQWLDV